MARVSQCSSENFPSVCPVLLLINFVFLQAIQKQHLVLERIHRLRQKANDTASQVESLQAELGRAKASLQIANVDNNKLLGQLNAAEKKQSELQAEVDTLKKTKRKACRAANNAGFNEAEQSYKKQVFATQDIYFKAGWKSACEHLGQGSDTDVFANPPPASLPVYLVPYANDVFSALQAEAEEGLEDGEDDTDSEAEEAEVPEQPGSAEPGAQEVSPTINLDAGEDEFTNLSP
ncbi:hypothetical protein CsSME_00021786 [Camellia sinensis var. sinensis]